uniref:Protein kinase domain-containing protein n=1 Tax=Angiostrongylus cantonensis TaxID=6313 RepID=A0A0K0DJ79_ANGCA
MLLTSSLAVMSVDESSLYLQGIQDQSKTYGGVKTSSIYETNCTQASGKEEKSVLPEERFQVLRTQRDHFTKNDEKILKNFDFYHGFLPREDLSFLLKEVGDYLLRVSEVDNDSTKIRRDIILSVSTEQKTEKSSTMKSSMNSGKVVKFTFMLKNSIKRQSWEYLHSDVEQGELLGKGAFGEVRAGKLQLKTGETIEVAIKVVTNGEFVQLPSCCPESLRNFFATKVFVKDPESRVNMTDVVIAFERATSSENSACRIRRKFIGFMQDVPRLSSL